MSTPHIAAEMGDFAKTVLMPGDPLRAQFIAETFLQDVRQVTSVRGMLGFTGTYEGRPISVMGSGMGMPSIGIYSYELYKFYGVENIVRIGSAGSYTDKARLFDVVLASGAVSESSYAKTQSGFEGHITFPSRELNEKLRASAEKLGIRLIEGNIHSSDVFYRQPSDAKPTYWEKLRDEQGCLCVEMESFALFANAPADHLGQLCLPRDHHRRAAPEELHRHDEGGPGRRVLKIRQGGPISARIRASEILPPWYPPFRQNFPVNRALAAKRLAHSRRKISLYVSCPSALVSRAGRIKKECFAMSELTREEKQAAMSELTREEKQALIRAAFEARTHAVAPYSHFAVGAALRSADGRVFTGCNIENAALTPTSCAERTALFSAVSQGVTHFTDIAVVGAKMGEVNTLVTSHPCHLPLRGLPAGAV